MNMTFNFIRQKISIGREKILFGIILASLMSVVPFWSANAINISMGGKPFTIMGYINQGVMFGIAGDHYDTKEGFQSAINQVLVEGKYLFSPDVQFFCSFKLNADWAYPILHNDSDWDDRQFDRSKKELYVLSHGRDIVSEMHLTWTPVDKFLLRLGKQIVSWGEMDVFRIMDQINPLDQRRGFTDVEFESTILPLWLVRSEYYLRPQTTWLTDVGFEFVFNPNADFRHNEGPVLGNDVAGIWAPNVEIPLGGAYPFDYAHLSSMDEEIHKPGSFDPDGFEYGFRLRTIMWNKIFTANYFYGRDNDLVALVSGSIPPRFEVSPDDGRLEMHLTQDGFYPLFRTLGATFTGDFENLYLTALGGVAPVLRLEAFYAFDNTFESSLGEYVEKDEVRWGIGIDWKIWLRFLNPRAAFMISPQFYHQHILGYPNNYRLTKNGGVGVHDDNYSVSVVINTTYFHNKLTPGFVWLRDLTNRSNFYKISLAYEYSHVWNYTYGVLLFEGDHTGRGFEPFEHKDQLFFTVGYRF